MEFVARVSERPRRRQKQFKKKKTALRRFCLQRTNAYSALEVLRLCAIQIHITLHYITMGRYAYGVLFVIKQCHVWYCTFLPYKNAYSVGISMMLILLPSLDNY